MSCPRPACNYYGSKWRLAPAIIDMLPAHQCYCEPYGGSMAVLLSKPPSYVETYNDLDGEVVSYFRVLREQPEDLIRAIELTPFARTEALGEHPPTEDAVELARRFYTRAIQCRGGPTVVGSTGWRWERTGNRHKPLIANWNETYHLWAIADRLKQVQIECDEALTVIQRFDWPSTVFYVDPPYPASTRKRWSTTAYRYEMTDQQHEELAALLHEIEGMAIVSSYPCALYERLYHDWHQVRRRVRTQAAKEATEVLWVSPRARAQRYPLLAAIEGEQVAIARADHSHAPALWAP